MELKFQLLGCDYFMNGSKPVVRLFGKTKEGKTVCAFYEGFEPYFYILPADNKTQTTIDFLNKNFSNLVKKIEGVKKFHTFNSMYKNPYETVNKRIKNLAHFGYVQIINKHPKTVSLVNK